MSVAMAELSRLGWWPARAVRGAPRAQRGALLAGAAGRPRPRLEIGATGVRAAAYSLDGREIGAAEERLPADHPTVTPEAADAAAGVVREVRGELGGDHGPLRQVVVAAPTLPTTSAGAACGRTARPPSPTCWRCPRAYR